MNWGMITEFVTGTASWVATSCWALSVLLLFCERSLDKLMPKDQVRVMVI